MEINGYLQWVLGKEEISLVKPKGLWSWPAIDLKGLSLDEEGRHWLLSWEKGRALYQLVSVSMKL